MGTCPWLTTAFPLTVSLEKHPCFLTCPWRMRAELHGGPTSVCPSPAQAVVREGAVATSQTAVCVSAGYNVNDLTLETINISFTLMKPFLPQLLLPGSQPFILLEKQVLQLVRCPLPCSWDWVVLPASLRAAPAQLVGRRAWREPSRALRVKLAVGRESSEGSQWSSCHQRSLPRRPHWGRFSGPAFTLSKA